MNNVPDNKQFAPLISSAQSSISTITNQLTSSKASVDNTLQRIPTTISNVRQQTDEVLNTQLSTANDSITTALGKINPYIGKAKRDEAQYWVISAENIRYVPQGLIYTALLTFIFFNESLTIVLIFIILLAIIYAISMLGLFCNNGGCFGCMSCFSYSVYFIYFILCSFQIVFFLLIADFCRESSNLPTKAETSFGVSNFVTLPNGIVISFNQTISNVYNCDGNTTFLDTTGITLQSLGVSSMYPRLPIFYF